VRAWLDGQATMPESTFSVLVDIMIQAHAPPEPDGR